MPELVIPLDSNSLSKILIKQIKIQHYKIFFKMISKFLQKFDQNHHFKIKIISRYN